MKSKASYFSISKPLIIENLRRFWAIPALAFLVYFLSGAFPILMSYRHLNDLANYIQMSLGNQQPFFMFAHLIFPIIAAVVIFRYLQGISSVSVMHAMPFTRAKLYNSGFVSGLILIIAPILVNGIILLAISKPVFNQYGTESGMVVEKINIFARTEILNWIWTSIVIVLVIYAVSVFAGIVTGNSLMHFATAAWFNFLFPALYGVFIAYFSYYLYGFDTTGNWLEYGMKISPFLNAIQNKGDLGVYSTIFYIASFFVLYGITGFLYQKRKLEHATDSLAFSFMEPIICYLIAFFGMTLLGFYFQVLGESELYMYAGLAAGTLIFFIIGQMIVKKTPRIYNMKSLKRLGIYVVIAVVFLAGLSFDATGFEKRVPNAGDVQSISLKESFASGLYNNYDYMDGNGTPFKGSATGLKFKDPKNIEAIIALHKILVTNKDHFEGFLKKQNSYSCNALISYNSDSTFPMTRRYIIDYNFYKENGEFKQIYESKEFKNYYAPSNINYIGLVDIYINGDVPNSESIEIKSRTDMKEFIDCLDKDFKAQTFEDMVDLKHGYAMANINYTYKDKTSDTPEKLLNNSVSYKITENYTNTIKWLEDHGYGGKFKQDVNNIDYIEIYHYVADENSDSQPVEYASDGKMIPSDQKGLKVSDPAKIQKLLDSYETQNINYNDYYYGNIFYKGNSLQGQNIDPAYAKEMAEKYGTEQAVNATLQIYFNEGNIPDYILDYFK